MKEAKKKNIPKDPMKALKNANRDEDIKLHGKPTAFRPTVTKNKKKYNRKNADVAKKVKLSEGQLRDLISETIKRKLFEAKWSEEDIYAEIEREGGMSWSDEDLGLRFYIKRENLKDGRTLYVLYNEEDDIIAISKYLHKAQRSLYNAVVRALEDIGNEEGIESDIDESSLGYDMNTPEGKEGSMKWMQHLISQEDPTGGYADQWVSNNMPDYPDISWDDCYERMKMAFMAGIEYGRNC